MIYVIELEEIKNQLTQIKERIESLGDSLWLEKVKTRSWSIREKN